MRRARRRDIEDAAPNPQSQKRPIAALALEMKRVAVFLPSLEGGGAQRSLLTVVNAFAARGLAVDLVLAKATGPFLSAVRPGVRVVDLGGARVFASLPALVRYIRRERPLAMLSALSHANVVAIWARWISNVPVRLVVSERNTLTQTTASSELFRARFIPWLMRISYPKADAVVAVSAGVAADLASAIGLSPSRISVIYNPVVGPELLQKSGEEIGNCWVDARDTPIVLAVGRLTAQKDYPTLIDAFARVHAQKRARLVILGEGEARGALENQIQSLGLAEHVLLPGFVDNPFPWMRRADVFVLSSRWEGLPGVLIQAMACGTPVVSTDCPSGPAEILANGRWGRLSPVGDVRALASAILDTLDDVSHPDVALRAQDFGEEKAVAAYLELMEATS
jgi:glycosyltransferase involved in cell wall biosynthesis